MSILTHDQVAALAEQMRDLDAETVSIDELAHGVFSATMFRDDSLSPAWMGTVSPAGSVRAWATIAA